MHFRIIHSCFLWIILILPAVSFAQDRKYRVDFEVTDGADLKRRLPSGVPARDSLELNSYLRSLLTDLWRLGYIEASIDSARTAGEELIVYIHGGKEYRWATIYMDAADKSQLKEFSLRNKRWLKGPVNPRDLADLRERIITACENNGYPFASISLEEVSIENGGVSARLDLKKNHRYTIDSIIIKGNARISEKYFHKLIGIDQGDPYRENELLMINRRVEETGFLSEIKAFELEFFQDKVDLYTYIDRRKGNQFNGIAGFLPDHSKSGKLLVTGDVNLLLINSFGRGESMYLNWKKLQPLSQELHIATSYPFLFNTSIGAGFNFDLIKQDTTYLTVNPVMNLHYYMDGMNYIRLYYDYSNSTVLNKADSPGVPLHADMNTSMYGLGLLFRKLDYQYNPRRGISAVLNMGVGSRKLTDRQLINSLPDGQAMESTTRYAGDGILSVFLPVAASFTVLLRNRSGWIRSDEIYDNEMFRLGGINSIRGVEENSVLASAYTVFTAEIRYLLEEHSNVYLFFDGGYYIKDGVSGSVEDTPAGFGTGISLGSRLGIFSINYALGREFGNPVNISRAKIHLGYISRF